MFQYLLEIVCLGSDFQSNGFRIYVKKGSTPLFYKTIDDLQRKIKTVNVYFIQHKILTSQNNHNKYFTTKIQT